MILLSLVLVLASAGLLIAGLGAGDHQLIWGSMVASVLAAICLAVAVFRRRAPVPAAVDVHPEHRETAGHPVTETDAGPISADPISAGPIDIDPIDAGPGASGAIESADGPADPPADSRTARDDAAPAVPAPPPDEPPEENASSTDVLRILDLLDEVMVVDQRPRYHLPECSHLIGKDAQPLPISEARGAGFTPCGRCRPDSTLADRARGGSA